MKIILYGNGGAGNHGCEAIVRGTVSLLEANQHSYIIHSGNPDEDMRYGLQKYGEIQNAVSPVRRDARFVNAYLKLKLLHNSTDMDGLQYLSRIRQSAPQANLALSVGGDNYCYSDTSIYAFLNRAYRKAGVKTVLWGCSVEPDVVATPQVSKDLASYSLVVARESLTYQAIAKVNPNTVLAPDPAFFMQPCKCDVDTRILKGNTVGVNVSPMIVSNETSRGITIENYQRLLRYILRETALDIALIPHVVWEKNDDRQVLNQLYHEFADSGRVIRVADHTAPELKYIISHCHFFIGARTHATIAAYSSGVPTLVVGYSVKAKGIAMDLFGTTDGYVLPVQALCEPDELKSQFKTLMDREKQIRTHLSDFMPQYLNGGDKARQALNALV